MINDLFERYKRALRRGHVAAARGQLDEAVVAYREAIELAPDRVLPYTGLSGVLDRLGRQAEALTVLDVAARTRPGRRVRLASAGGPAHRRESPGRCRRLAGSAGRHPRRARPAVRRLRGHPSRPSTWPNRASAGAVSRRMCAAWAATPMTRSCRQSSDRAQASLQRSRRPALPAWPTCRSSADLLAATEAAMSAGDTDAILTTALATSAAQRRDGLLDAALDTCYLALSVAPADPAVHLALTDLYLDRGWRTAAVDKVLLLGQLADLTGDAATRDRLAALVAARLADEPRLVLRKRLILRPSDRRDEERRDATLGRDAGAHRIDHRTGPPDHGHRYRPHRPPDLLAVQPDPGHARGPPRHRRQRPVHRLRPRGRPRPAPDDPDPRSGRGRRPVRRGRRVPAGAAPRAGADRPRRLDGLAAVAGRIACGRPRGGRGRQGRRRVVRGRSRRAHRPRTRDGSRGGRRDRA